MAHVAFCRTEQVADIFLNASTQQMFESDELVAMGGYAHHLRRLQFLAGRLAAKNVVRQRLHLARNQSVRISNSGSTVFNKTISKTKPFVLIDGHKVELDLSISHCDDVTCAVAGDCRVGVDVEKIRARSSYFYQDVLASDELAFFNNLKQDQDFFGTLFWTAKEAMSKFLGLGLSVPFSAFQIELSSLQKIAHSHTQVSDTDLNFSSAQIVEQTNAYIAPALVQTFCQWQTVSGFIDLQMIENHFADSKRLLEPIQQFLFALTAKMNTRQNAHILKSKKIPVALFFTTIPSTLDSVTSRDSSAADSQETFLTTICLPLITQKLTTSNEDKYRFRIGSKIQEEFYGNI